MVKLADMVEKVRSKNAGPFWLTIDVFCGDSKTFEKVDMQLSTAMVAQALQQAESSLKRFSIPDLNVVKFSLPRPHIQGSRLDRDMHGAQWGLLIAEIELVSD